MTHVIYICTVNSILLIYCHLLSLACKVTFNFKGSCCFFLIWTPVLFKQGQFDWNLARHFHTIICDLVTEKRPIHLFYWTVSMSIISHLLHLFLNTSIWSLQHLSCWSYECSRLVNFFFLFYLWELNVLK